jgi:hypothetical protein
VEKDGRRENERKGKENKKSLRKLEREKES